MMSEKEAVSEDARTLDPAAVERLDTLLDEMADMSVALGRLLKEDSNEDCPAAFIELHRALDSRLARAIDLVAGGDGEVCLNFTANILREIHSNLEERYEAVVAAERDHAPVPLHGV